MLKGARSGTLFLLSVVIALILLLMTAGFLLAQAENAGFQKTLDATSYFATERSVYRSVLDMETAQRGYIITSNPKFLDPYTQAAAALPISWNILLTQANQIEGPSANGPSPARRRQ